MNTARTQIPLDAPWTLVYDPDDRGIREQWFSTPPEDGRTTVHLPAMQDQGIARHGGVGWFIHTFDFAAEEPDPFVVLDLESLNYPAQVWLNGTRLGDLPGGGAPGQFPVTAHLQPGPNTLALRLAVFESGEDPVTDSCHRYPRDTPGQLSLTVLPRAHIADIFVQPDIRRKRIVISVEAPADCSVHLQVEGTPYHVQGAPGELILDFPEFEPWNIDSPRCYTLQAALTAPDGRLDHLSTVFAMREFTVKDGRFYLNNRPLYLKAVAYRADYPGSLRPDKLRVLLKREVELARDAGFNAIRVEAGPAPVALLDQAAEAGLLVFQELPGLAEDTAPAIEALVTRDRNQPALACWCGLPAPDGDTALPAVAAQLRALDPGRLILCDGLDGAEQWYVRPYRDTPEPYESFTTSAGAPLNQLTRDYLRLCGDPERLNWQRALASGGATRANDTTAAAEFAAEFTRRQLERCFPDEDQFHLASQQLQADGLQAQLDAVRANLKMVGYGVRYLCDGPDTAPFGLADAKRQPKPALKILKQVQQPVRPVIQMHQYNLTPRQEVGVTILLINEARIEGRGELSLQVVGPTNQVLWKKKRLVKIPRHGRELWSGAIAASGSPGPHRFVVRLMQDRQVIGENSARLHVVQPLNTEPVEINVPGGRGPLRTACGRQAKLGNILAPVHIVPPLANTIRAYPAADLLQILAQVAEGAVAIVFQPPDDWNELAEMLDGALAIKSRPVTGQATLAHHYAKLHPIFEGLPSRDLMRQPYQNVLPLESFAGADEDISGVHCRYAGGEHWWGANVVVRRLGAGRVVFTHLRLLEHLGADPVADRIFLNLLNHFARRSVPPTESVGADQKVMEWLNQERNNAVRKWMLLGSFPNWNGRSGHDAVLPPEKELDLDATYPGWYRAIRWKPWWTRDTQAHRIDFHAALDTAAGTGEICRYATAFAYAEFSCDRREEVLVGLEGDGAIKAWLNGNEIVDTVVDATASAATGWVKQGRNTLLVKYSKGPGPYTLSVTVDPVSDTPLILNWWK